MMTNCSPPLWKTKLKESKNKARKQQGRKGRKEGRKKGNSEGIYMICKEDFSDSKNC